MALIEVSDLSFTYEGSSDPVFEHVSFRMDTDWRLGLVGRNGRGKTTLLRLLMGGPEYTGSIVSHVMFDYFPYPVSGPERMAYEVLEDLPGSSGYEFWQLQREMERLRLPEEVLYRSFETLSHGERTKLLLAALFLQEGHFLLIDEPTNHLDGEARRLVSQYLSKKKGFLLVSHDQAFLDGCVDHVLALNRNGLEVQKGNFSSWYENKQRQDASELARQDKLKKDIRRLQAAGGVQPGELRYQGRLRTAAGIKISWVPQDASFLAGSLKDYASLCGIEESLFFALLRKLDFTREQLEKPMESFSAGQKKKVLIARSLCEQAHLYIWDEPLNYIDLYSRIQIEDLILKFSPTMLFVEHDEAFVRKVATGIVSMGRKG